MASKTAPATDTTTPARKPRRKPHPRPSRDPIEALRDKIFDEGFRFVQEHAITALGNDYKTRMVFRVELETIITTGAKWMDMRESADSRWSCAVAGEGLVIATMFRHPFYNPGDGGKVHSRGLTEHDPDRLRALQAFRSMLFDALEARGDVRSLEMRAGGNGDCEMRVTLKDRELGCDITLDISADD